MTSIRMRQRLSTQVLTLQLAIILVMVVAGAVVMFVQARRNLDVRTGQQSLSIARTVASDPEIIASFSAPDPAKRIDPIAERIRRAAGASFVVVANEQGIRYSHPNPALIGKSLLHDPGENPSAVLGGKSFVGTQTGSLGRSMRAKVPIRRADGAVIGMVSVGVLESHISSELWATLPASGIPPLVGLIVGLLGAFLLAHRVKRQTFGLEPRQIAELLNQREAMLHGIREGTIAFDRDGRLTLINDEAARLLGMDVSALGRTLDEILPYGRLRDVLSGAVAGSDQVVLVAERILLVNRMPIEVLGRPVGAIATLRDRTELESLLHEIDDMRNLTDALRAQEHEFSNRLHVIGGLIELGQYEEAMQFVNHNSRLHQELADALMTRVNEPILSALLLGKASIASERGVRLQLSAPADLPADRLDSKSLVTILGNLIDNAIDSAARNGPSGQVDVSITLESSGANRADRLVLTVHDSGSGIDPAETEEIFRDGFTTKIATGTRRKHGLGLSLVSQTVRVLDGIISVDNVDGAVITVSLPVRAGHAAVG